MVYAYVPSWTKIEIPETVQTFAELEQYIPKAATERGIDISRPFPFRIEGEVSALDWFVVNGMGNGVPNYLVSFFRSRYLGGLDDRKIEGLGFYSQSHRGVLTNPRVICIFTLKLQMKNYLSVTLMTAPFSNQALFYFCPMK